MTVHDTDTTKMTAAELLTWCGLAADRWAHAFCQSKARRAEVTGEPIGIDEAEMIGWFANAIEHTRDVRRRAAGERLTASEAVYGLLAWLTCRERVLTVSAHHEAGQVVKLAEMFIAANKLGEVRSNYSKHLTHPTEPPQSERELDERRNEIPSLSMVVLGAGGDPDPTMCTLVGVDTVRKSVDKVGDVEGMLALAWYDARYCTSVIAPESKADLRYATFRFPVQLRSGIGVHGPVKASVYIRSISDQIAQLHADRLRSKLMRDEALIHDDLGKRRAALVDAAGTSFSSSPVPPSRQTVMIDAVTPGVLVGIGPEPYHPGRIVPRHPRPDTLEELAALRVKLTTPPPDIDVIREQLTDLAKVVQRLELDICAIGDRVASLIHDDLGNRRASRG